jgi:SagB-type dehydrogenase family enzyme
MEGIGREFMRGTKWPAAGSTEYGPVESAVRVPLSRPEARESASLSALLAARRSRRKFGGEAIGEPDLSWLLWAADGIAAQGGPVHFRTAPSAGARHPIDTYVAVLRVDGVEPGIYRYVVDGHALERIRTGDFESACIRAAAEQDWLTGAVAVVIWAAQFARTASRYKERGYRHVLLDAGHICQNLYLGCESIGLGITSIAALIDDEVNALVGIDGRDASVVYMAGVGNQR